MFKQSSLLPYNCLQSLQASIKASTTSPSSHRSSVYKPLHRPPCRTYAMVSDGYSSHNHGNLRWPEVTSADAVPTPYQIFNQKKGSPYSKQRFYELVKIYHPDRHEHGTSRNELPYATKLERYRLVVAANDLLSDPIKRGAYDRYGAGWNGMPGVDRSTAGSWGDARGRGWGSDPNGPSNNATWEDWERWYARNAEGPQEPRFVSNGTFVVIIVAFMIIGGIGQAHRAESFSINFLEQRDGLHNTISKDLMRRRRETASVGNREERITNFLKQRDPLGQGFLDPRDEGYRKMLPAPGVASKDLKSTPTESHGKNIDIKDG
ncbi:hypothetical protein HYFRA_00008630 [Hymenoscyphus fraxineus]|uniref:J domain-containing protein n=1 Tax=Hymenoscyphus fraxineus TaxID=746836 RepID=A0A9N9KW57_9HELO|nr:hypothetical protein HYFRA_00008630 [Hymenoscyphus fraxineus]